MSPVEKSGGPTTPLLSCWLEATNEWLPHESNIVVTALDVPNIALVCRAILALLSGAGASNGPCIQTGDTLET